jgi:hypothetical protein
MAGISVRMAQMPYTEYITVAGTLLAFDFSDDVGTGEQVLAFSVGLSFFQVEYATNSKNSSESVAQMAVSLVPNLVGNVVYSTANLILTDFGGDGAGEPQDYPALTSYIWATCIAYIGTSDAGQTAVLGTGYDLISGVSSPDSITIGSDRSASPLCFLSGFDVYFTPKGNKSSPGGFSASAGFNQNAANSITLNGTVTLSGSASSGGTVDVGYLSTIAGVDNYTVVPLSFEWSTTNDQIGRTAPINQSITIPAGYSQIKSNGLGLLIQSVTLSLSGNQYIHEIDFGLTGYGLTLDSQTNTVSGIVEINMWGERNGNFYLDSGDLIAYLIVQFE